MKPTKYLRCLILAAASSLLAPSTGFAQTVYRWVGTTSDWTTASNWVVESGPGGTPPPTGGTIDARLNVGATGNLTPGVLNYTSDQGTTIFDTANRALVIASATSLSTATVTISGGTFDSQGTGDIISNASTGTANSGTLNIAGGTYTNVNASTEAGRTLVVGFNGGTANLNISSGSAITERIRFLQGGLSQNTIGNIALSGTGILETGGFTRGVATGTHSLNISFDGGTLRARGADNADFMTSAVVNGNALVRAGGVAIDTNGSNIGISKALTQDGGSPGGGLIKSGAGNLTLSGVNTYTGATSIDAGTLTLGNATNTLINTGAVNVNGGTLALGANSDTVGAVTLTSGNITSSTGVLTGSSYAVESGSVSAILGGSGIALTKTTGGTVTLTGVNTYTGATTVNAGTLAVNGAGSINGSSGITLDGGQLDYSSSVPLTASLTFTSGTLGGTGTINGDVVLDVGTIAPGTSPGTLTIDGSLSLGTSSLLAFELDAGDQTPGGGINDLIAVTGAGLTLDGTLNVTSSALSAGTWTLINYGGGTFTNNGLDIGTLNLASGHTASIQAGGGFVNLVVVPEPATIAILGAGAALLGLHVARRCKA